MAADWSRLEVEAVVADYFAMLAKELSGVDFNKTEHRRALSSLLNGRSKSSIEWKHQNISAVLIELGYPYVAGYKPRHNYQRLLAEVVTDRVSEDQVIRGLVERSVEEPAQVPSVEEILQSLVDRPDPSEPVYSRNRDPFPFERRVRPPVNYLEREARNASLGEAGEQFVLRFEKARLIAAGRDALADHIEHVSITKGDGLGFDVRSFEENGTDRFIEVKTTAYGKQTPFFVSANEVFVSAQLAPQFHLYRVFQFRKDPRLFTMEGALERSCHLRPVSFEGRVR